MAALPMFEELTWLLEWPLAGLLLRLALFGLLASAIARAWSAGLRLAWVRGFDPERRLAATDAPLRAALALVVLILVMQPLVVTRPMSAVVLGGVLLVGASVWGFREMQNVVAGITLSITRPFRVGVEMEGAGQRGEVIRIGLTRVRIRTADGDLADIPTRLLTGGGVRVPAPGSRALPILLEVALPPRMTHTEAVGAVTDQVLLSTWVNVIAPVHVTLISDDRARIDATPSRPEEGPLLASDVRARVAALGRGDLLS